MGAITKRNLKIFFRDKTAVFYSLLASFIMIGLYFLFLGDNLTSSLKGIENARDIMDNWLIAGLMAITSLTTTMSVFGIRINDNVDKISKDFFSAPISKRSLAGGYIVSAYVVGLIMSLATYILAEIFVFIRGGIVMDFASTLKIFLVVLIVDFANSAMMLFVTSLFNSHNAYSAAGSIIGTLVGFVTGIYMPIGVLPEWVQWIIKCFPTSHGASIIRQIMMNDALEKGFANAPSSVLEEFQSMLGITYTFGDYTVSNLVSIGILVVTGAVFYALGVINISKKKVA